MRELTLFFKIILFFTSYIPFYLMYWVIDYKNFNNSFPYIHFKTPLSWLFLIFFFSIFFLFYMIKFFQSLPNPDTVEVKSCKSLDNEITSYLVTYILPLLTFSNNDDNRNMLILVILMILIAILYIKSDMFAINPILMLMGYHIVEIDYKQLKWRHTKPAILLTNKSFYEMNDLIKKHKMMKIIRINKDLYMFKGEF